MIIAEKRFNELIESFSNLEPLLVVGDVGLDKYTYGHVKRISPEAPVPILEVDKEWFKLGLAANVNDNLQSLTVPSILCSIVGNDDNALVFERLLAECNLKNDFIFKETSRKTTLKERITTKGQQICRVDYETLDFISSDIQDIMLKKIEEKACGFSSLILEDYGKGLLSRKFIQRLISIFKDQKKMIFIDPSRKTPPDYFYGSTLLKPNFDEAQIIAESFGYRNLEVSEMAKLLVDKLCLEKIVITLGAQGMGLIDTKNDGGFKIIPTMAKEVYDVSGAGDTAISVIAAGMMAGASLEESTFLGNMASGIVVGKRGTATVTLKELKSFYLSLVNNIC